jgi:hypothetical protein
MAKITHDEACRRNNCLCDVQIGTPVPIMNIDFARDYYAAREIVAYQQPSYPWDVDSMLTFFQTACRLKDIGEVYIPDPENPSQASAKVTPAVRYYVAARITEGVPNKQIRDELQSEFNLTITSQYLSMLKHRLWKEKQ